MESYTANLALLMLRSRSAADWRMMTTGIALFSLPLFLISFLVLSAFQVLYLNRLALSVGDTEKAK